MIAVGATCGRVRAEGGRQRDDLDQAYDLGSPWAVFWPLIAGRLAVRRRLSC